MNKFTNIIMLSVFCAFTCATFADEVSPVAEPTAKMTKIEKNAFKLISSKKQKKLLEKAKNHLETKVDEMVVGIIDSALSDSQKVALIEALDSAKSQLEKE